MKVSESIHSATNFVSHESSVSFWCLTSWHFPVGLHCFGNSSSEFRSLFIFYFLYKNFSCMERKTFHETQIRIFSSQFQIRFSWQADIWNFESADGREKNADYIEQFHLVIGIVVCCQIVILWKIFSPFNDRRVLWAPSGGSRLEPSE